MNQTEIDKNEKKKNVIAFFIFYAFLQFCLPPMYTDILKQY